ncbi:DUF4190 domain-containing protein [Allorhizocola rhizosphaerae]|uniref:DUF4190 domain-containing protein n=1 Tax=Allorhizocola rhizosphaerae TaxID=1872709 RepID=UPI000E3C8790|nr:DUF4190 domain-containing protein [Allorhizocola rhizosphaerae]
MTYPPPPGTPDPFGSQPDPTPQDPFAAQPSNPYAQQPVSPPQPPQPPAAPSYGPSSAPPYGAPYAQQQPYGYAPAAPPQNTMALVSMILSLVGILVSVTAPVGAILGHVALKQIRQTGESGEGMAKTGIIVGWIVTGLYGLCCIGYIIFVVAAIGSSGGFN